MDWEGLGYIKYKNKLHLLSLTDAKQDVFLPWFGFRKCLFKKNFYNRQKKKRTKSQKENIKKITKKRYIFTLVTPHFHGHSRIRGAVFLYPPPPIKSSEVSPGEESSKPTRVENLI